MSPIRPKPDLLPTFRPRDRPARPMRKLAAERVESLLPGIPGWRVSPDRTELWRTFELPDPGEAVRFVTRICWSASRRFGEPWFSVRRKRFQVRLSTPSVGGLTQADFAFARKLNQWMEEVEQTGKAAG